MKEQLEILQESIFSKIDPILRHLLYSIEQELALSSSSSSSSSSNLCSFTTDPTATSTAATTGLVHDYDHDSVKDVQTDKEEEGGVLHDHVFPPPSLLETQVQEERKGSLGGKRLQWQKKLCRDVLFLQNMQVELFQRLQIELEAILVHMGVDGKDAIERRSTADTSSATRTSSSATDTAATATTSDGGVMDNDHHVDDDHVAVMIREMICQMQRYILLPILLKLQNPFCHHQVVICNSKSHDGSTLFEKEGEKKKRLDISSNTSSSSGGGGSEEEDLSSNMMLVIRNHCRRSLEGAICCLKLLLRILLPWSSCRGGDGAGEKNDGSVTTDLVHVELKVQLMVALWTSLSSMVKEYISTLDSTTMSSTHGSKSSLDKGEECMFLVLECMEVLCFVQQQQQQQQRQSTSCKGMAWSNAKKDTEFVSRLESCMDGRFIILLVQCTLPILDDNKVFQQGHENIIGNNNTFNSNAKQSFPGQYVDMKGNVKLKVQVLSFLRVLMNMGVCNGVSDPDDTTTNLWRSIFPGIFKTLFREALLHLRFTTSQSSSKLAMDLIQTLTVLLNRTLCIPSKHETVHGHDMSYREVFLLRGDVNSNEDSKTCLHGDAKHNDTQEFLDNVHAFLPRPLIMILKLIPLQKTTAVKIIGARNFCRCILIESRESLVDFQNNPEGVEDIVSVAFESLITMVADPDEKLAKECKVVLHDYRNSLGETEWNKIAKNIVIPRLVNLIQSLPNYAKGGRESDLSSNLQLISGYLLSFVQDGYTNDLKCNLSKNNLSKALFQKLTCNKVLRQCLVDIFVMDNVYSGVSKIVQNNGRECGSFQIAFRFLRGSTLMIAHHLIRNMQKVLGYRRAISLSEDCIVEFYGVLTDRINHNRSLCDKEQSRFVEKHFGLIVLAKELIVVSDSNCYKKHRRFLNSLASTLIPMIVSETMWELPTISMAPINGPDAQFRSLTSAPVLSNTMISQTNRIKDAPPSLDAMNGNSTVIICLMDFISKLAAHLGPDFVKFVPLVLYPIVQKISDLSSQAVRDAAKVTLIKISDATGHPSVQRMLLSNYRYLMETLTIELSNPYEIDHERRSQAKCFHSLHGMIDLMLRNTDDLCNEDVEDRIMLLTDMQRSIIFWFGRQYTRNEQDLLNNITIPLRLCNVITTNLRFLHCCMVSFSHLAPSEFGTSMEQFSWEEMLWEFQTTSANKREMEHEAVDAAEHSQKTSSNLVSGYVLEKLTKDIEQVLLVNGTFLSLPNLKLQVKACELFVAAFELLFTIQQQSKLGNQVECAENNVGNPLLQAVSKHWSTIEIRFQRAVVDFIQPLGEKYKSSPKRYSAVLLSALLDIIKCLNVLCGDFITGRFSSSIWPHMSKILAFLLPRNHNTTVETYSETDSSLLISLLSCISQTFSTAKCGRMLANIAPVIGTMLLPFLSFDGKIGDAAMCTIREILRIDCDCLWRPFLSLSRTGFPERLLLPLTQLNYHKCAKSSLQDNKSNILTERVENLLVFVENLPEQEL